MSFNLFVAICSFGAALNYYVGGNGAASFSSFIAGCFAMSIAVECAPRVKEFERILKVHGIEVKKNGD